VIELRSIKNTPYFVIGVLLLTPISFEMRTSEERSDEQVTVGDFIRNLK